MVYGVQEHQEEKEERAKRKKVLLRKPRLVETRNAFSALEEEEISSFGLILNC